MCLLVHFWKVLVSMGWIIHQIFHYGYCPSCNNSIFPTILKCILKSFFSGKPFHRNNDSAKGWGEHLPALSSKAQAPAPQHYRYLRNSHFCSWLPSFSHQNILLLLRTMFVFWGMPNAPISFPVFRKIIQKVARKIRGDGQSIPSPYLRRYSSPQCSKASNHS